MNARKVITFEHQEERVEKPQPKRLLSIVREPELRTADVENRLQELNQRIDNLSAASYLVWLKAGPHVFDPMLDLRVKVEAVRWMMRIAKHLKSSKRETVFLTIKNSLNHLEEAIDSEV